MKIETVKTSSLVLDSKNARKHDEKNLAAIKNSLQSFGQRKPIVITETNTVVAGNGTLQAALDLQWTEIEVVRIPQDWTEEQITAFAPADNRTAELAEWDDTILAESLLDLDAAGWDIETLGFDVPQNNTKEEKNATLVERFLVPPFSVFDTRAGYWQERKKWWIDLGIKSEEGRQENLLKYSKTIAPEGLTSIFDPVLCEIAYRWFASPGAQILDPFAGGSVRGITAAYLDHNYTGLELSKTQVEANQKQAEQLLENQKGTVTWIIGDSNKTLDEMPHSFAFDLIFSCPPYADLEVYSDDPDDISNMPYPKFLEIYRSIIKKTVSKLKNDRFAIWVISEVRDKKTGIYRNFVPHTIQAFEDAGMSFYNEAIFLNAVGNTAMRAGNYFTGSRKLGRIHQNVLIFVKGDPKKATEFCGTFDIEIPNNLDMLQ